MWRILSFLFFLTCVAHLGAQSPKHEVRAAWITTVYGLDWPRTRGTSPDAIRRQKQELIEMLDRLKAARFNTVLFQARTRGDVCFDSAIEPYNAIFTGQVGRRPDYDPLAFAVEECHKRGMECHAWMVAIPLGNRRHVASLGASSVTKKHKDICVAYKNEYFLNPGHPQTKDYLFSIVKEVVSRYDVDGVHLDYLRYPEHSPKFPDQATYKRYGNGKPTDEWRRDNLTAIVRHVYKGVKQLKPWVKVSTCPVGKYRDVTRYSSRGWNAYHVVSQDAQAWLKEGIHDQIYPMIYFRGNNFYPFALDWLEQSNGRHIVPGLGIYFLDPSEGNWQREEIDRQIHFTRRNRLAGQGHYRAKYLMNNTQGLYDELADNLYRYEALQPAMPWLDAQPPTDPTHGVARRVGDGYVELSWEASTDNDPMNPPMYVIYGSDEYPVDTSRSENIVTQRIRHTHYVHAPLYPWMRKNYFAVTAIDRYGNESRPLQLSPR